MLLFAVGEDFGAVCLAGTAVDLIVGVEYLSVYAVVRHADEVVLSVHRLEVADNDDVVAFLVDTSERDNGLLIVVMVDPVEAFPCEVDLMHAGVRLIELVERAEEVVELLMLLKA